MAENELTKEQTKEINGVSLTDLEISKIAMICDYLVVDRFNDISSFFRFEKCFGPLLSKEDPNLLIEAFQEICGTKKKYITFGRLISAYIKWKTNSSKNENFNKFMKIVFNDMIKTENEVIGKLEEGTRIFSTRNTRGRKVISKFGVFTDASKNCIQGFNIQYDDFFDSLLCTKKKEGDDKNINLEIHFAPNGKTILDRDGISHIAGKFSVAEKIVKFLIFKCRSGKTFCIGDNTEKDDEQIQLFIFGTSSCQLKTLRIETINDKLAYLEPKFQPSMRINHKIVPFESIDEKFINENVTKDRFIFEENDIKDVPIEKLDKNSLLVPCIEDDALIADKSTLTEPIFGKNFNEVYIPYLEREKIAKVPSVDEELKKNLIDKTVKRVSIIKCFARKNTIKENIKVLKSHNKPEEERVKMDKYLAKIKRFKKKMVNKKNELNKIEEEEKKIKDEDNLEGYEQEEDWPDDEKKEEEKGENIIKEKEEEVIELKKEEEKNEEEKNEEEKNEEGKKEEEKKEEKEEEKNEEKKNVIKVEEIIELNKEEDKKEEENKQEEKKEEKKEEENKENDKDEEKIEQEVIKIKKEEENNQNEIIEEEKKEEEKKEDDKKEENKEKNEENKEEEKKVEIKIDIPVIENEDKPKEEIKEEENQKEEKINIEKNEEIKINIINSNDNEEIKLEENEDKPEEKKIRLRGKPKKLGNKKVQKTEEIKIEKEEEDKKEDSEEKNIILAKKKK